jgi:hypothetical protein
MIVMIMMMGWDYFSEMRPPTDVLFIPHVIYEHLEPWIGMGGGKQIRSPELSENPTSGDIQ